MYPKTDFSESAYVNTQLCCVQMMDGPKLMKKADSRAADRLITDMLTSIFTTTDIPVNTVFGPCDLNHSSLYDSIAFIALKCSDRRTAPYTLKVRNCTTFHKTFTPYASV